MSRPVVSIGVPTYNRVAMLEKAVGRMLAQDYGDLEIVISDNASTDGTQDYCRELCRRDERVRYYRNPTNIGAIGNYGEVLRRATGEYYMHLADDDELDPSYVARCVEALSQGDLLNVCGKPLMYRDGVFAHPGALTNLLSGSPEERLLEYLRTVQENGAFHGVVRREVLASLPPMRPVFGGDWCFMASVAFSGKIKTLDDTAVHKHMGGTTRSMENIARALGLPEIYGTYWIESVMSSVFQDIAFISPVYAGLGRAGRLSLAARAMKVLFDKYRWRFSDHAQKVLGPVRRLVKGPAGR